MRHFRFALTSLALAAATTAQAQAPFIKPDNIEVKRIGALAMVQRLSIPARQSYDPQVKLSDPGKGCTFNIGDIAAAKAADPANPAQPALERRGVGRTEYVTIVDATPICVQR